MLREAGLRLILGLAELVLLLLLGIGLLSLSWWYGLGDAHRLADVSICAC